jgi:integrase
MSYLLERNGIFYVRVVIPSDVRRSFGGRTAAWRSLRTRDPVKALELGAPIVADIQRQIERARRHPHADEAPEPVSVPLDPDLAWAAIQRWRRRSIDRSYVRWFNEAPPVAASLSDEASARSRLRAKLRAYQVDLIPEFDGALLGALRSENVILEESHPALPNLRRWFCEAWADVEDYDEKFRWGKFAEWEMIGSERTTLNDPHPAPAPLLHSGTSATADLTITELLNAFIASQRPSSRDAQEITTYVRRLVEGIGDLPARQVSTRMMDKFLAQVRRFPVTKRPDILRLPFNDIIDRYGENPRFRHLSNKTIRAKWFGAYNRLFSYACRIKIISENPVSGVIPRKSADVVTSRRQAWTDDQVAELFKKPLFTGASSARGTRNRPGSILVKDEKYWLPIVALWTGMRLGEIGTLDVGEVKADDGTPYLDLRDRLLDGPRRVKNDASRRIVPIHRRLAALGFLDYVKQQERWVFPQLPHEGVEPGEATAAFSKWFGRWRVANGLGGSSAGVVFHSFRWSFKSACRRAGLAEDVHDLLTGHAGTPNQQVSRGYRGADDPKWLGEQMNRIDFPTFPL